MSALNDLSARLAAGQAILIDGATGTELERRGAAMNDEAWCAMATETHSDILREVHESYILAGAKVITANTFSSNRAMLARAGHEDRFEAVNRKAIAVATEARERMRAIEQVVVAGSMSHQMPITPGTASRDPALLLPPAVARERFVELAQLLKDAGAEMILLEMMSDPEYANDAIAAAVGTGLPVWVGFSVGSDEHGKLHAFSRPDLGASEMFAEISLTGAAVAGVMHSSANITGSALNLLREHYDGPLMAYPDSGHFVMPSWNFEAVMSHAEFVDYCHQWLAEGVTVVGGCCGLGIEHIAALAAEIDVRERD